MWFVGWRRFWHVSLALLLCWCLFGMSLMQWLYGSIYSPGDNRVFLDSDLRTAGAPGVCIRPHLELWHPSIKVHFHVIEPLNCQEAPEDWIRIDSGRIRINVNVTKRQGDVLCECRAVIRINQTDMSLGDPVKPCVDGQQIPADAITVRCVSARGGVYRNIHLGVKADKAVLKRVKNISPPENALGLNILMLGFDTVSRLNWLRNLPKTHDYFTRELGGVTLEGYNIVGDGTPQALLPILTGKSEEELPEARRGFHGADYVDSHPWIWNDLVDAGYVTQFGEDDTVTGTFEYRMMGFKKQPVDHYLRPYRYLVQRDYLDQSRPHCTGSHSQLDNILSGIRQLHDAYPSTPKFSFLFHNAYSHDHFSGLQLADEALKEFLVDMEASGYLNNTLLVLMSDHGARFAQFRGTQQGKYEERLPYFSLRLPGWFEKRYPEAVKNLRNNVDVITTPFDIHETFKDVISYTNRGIVSDTPRGISLFQAIPKDRTCGSAAIAPHWCTCMDWQDLPVSDSHVIASAQIVVSTINKLLIPYQEQCATLSLDTIVSSMIFSPKRDLLKFRQSSDPHGRVADLSSDMRAASELYQVTFVTTPGGGKFEATVTHDMDRNGTVVYQAELTAVSRLNAYGTQPHCVMTDSPHLRPYCYCKTQVEDRTA